MKFWEWKVHIVGFKFKLKDFWIGFYWENNQHDHWLNIWICIIPMVPFQIAIEYGPPGAYVAQIN